MIKTLFNGKFKVHSMTGYYIDEFCEGEFRLNRILKKYDTKEEAKQDLFKILAGEIGEEDLN